MQKDVSAGTIFCVSESIYSGIPHTLDVEIVLVKYRASVLTLNSAYYYCRLSDELLLACHLATDRSSIIIGDERVTQSFVPHGTLAIGMANIAIDGVNLRIYAKEHVLIETMRNRTKLPYDLYREVVSSFRDIRNTLYGAKIADHLAAFPKRDSIMDAIRREVYW